MSFAKNKSRAMKRLARLMAPVAMASALVTNAGCATVQEMNAESKPYGEQLKERVAQWDEWCKKEKLGPYLEDPKKKHITTCDFLALKDKRWDPSADEFSRYAHSIKLPPPYDKPQAQYKEGMTSKEYFEELCAKEAGQWIFKKVEGVEGILQVRPYIARPEGLEQLVPQAQEIVLSGSADDETWLAMAESKNSYFKNKFTYSFFEMFDDFHSVKRYYRNLETLQNLEPGAEVQWRTYVSRYRVPYVFSKNVRAQYAYLGRGLYRPEFEKHGITGTELIVFEYKTLEIVGLIKNFYSVRPVSLSPGQFNKEGVHKTCPNAPNVSYAPSFVLQVLNPKK